MAVTAPAGSQEYWAQVVAERFKNPDYVSGGALTGGSTATATTAGMPPGGGGDPHSGAGYKAPGPPGGAAAWKGYSPAQKAAFLRQSGGLDPTQYASLMGLTLSSTPWWKGGERGVNVTPGYMPANYTPRTDAGALHLINQKTGGNYATLEEAKAATELGFQMAGREQYVRNQGAMGSEGYADKTGTAPPDRIPPFLQNVQMQGFADPNAYTLFLNSLLGMSAKQGAQTTAQRQELVPDWMPGVRDYLVNEADLPYVPVELFSSPGFNLTDPNQPLYGPGTNPASMIGLTGGQAGENAFYRSLSAEELMREIAPLYWAYYHRPEGAPVPQGFEAGMTFGSPVYNPESGNYTRSPVQGLYGGPQDIGQGVLQAEGLEGETDPYVLGRQLAGGLYNRWSAYGYPGTGSQSTVGGPRLQGMGPNGAVYEDYRVSPFGGGYANDPYFQDFWAEETFQPWQNLDPDDYARLLALAGSPSGAGTPFG